LHAEPSTSHQQQNQFYQSLAEQINQSGTDESSAYWFFAGLAKELTLLFNVSGTKRSRSSLSKRTTRKPHSSRKGKGKPKANPEPDLFDMDVEEGTGSEEFGLDSPTAEELAFMDNM
jgi:hypothetical protein